MAIDAFFPKITLPKGKTDIRKGEGLGIKYTSENGKVIVMVVDAFEGGEPTRGLIDWLKSIDVKQIDLAVATHAHGDHFGGFYEIAEAGIKIKDFRCYHPDSIRDGNAASREDSDNLLELIRWLQARGTRVLFVDHGDVLEFGDIKWHIYRKQPKGPAAKDDPNAWSYVNDGSLVLCSPELSGIIFGDGPAAQKEAIAYFQKKFGRIKFIIWVTVSHHGGHFSMSNAQSARNAGCEFAYESCVERRGPGKEEWTEFGARRLIQNGVTVWMQDENIYIHAAAGKITFKQGSKMLTYDIPYQGEEKEGWVKNATGWWYKKEDGNYYIGWAKLKWSGGTNYFYFDAKGYMVTGWRKIKWSGGTSWFLFDFKDGYMRTGWQRVAWSGGTSWFYFDPIHGDMQTGWKKLKWSGGTNWFYFDRTNGNMLIGWQKINGSWYFLNTSHGFMQTGWMDWRGRRCYLDGSGRALCDCVRVIDGKTYRFDGACYATEISPVTQTIDRSKKFIDVSEFQNDIDWSKASKVVGAAYIRCGLRGSLAKTAPQDYKKIRYDKKWAINLAEAQKYGIPFSAYYFPTAITDTEALEGAKWFYEVVKDLNLAFPPALDSENVWGNNKEAGRANGLSKSERTRLLKIVTDYFNERGMNIGIYASASWLNSKVDMSAFPKCVRDCTWVADSTGAVDYKGYYWLHQYGKGACAGFGGDVDLNRITGNVPPVRNDGKPQTEQPTEDPIDVLIRIMEAEVDTHEGPNNHTKYGDEMHALQPRNMDKNAAWCDAFFDWCILKLCEYFGYGADMARKVLCGDFDDYTYASSALYKKAGRWSSTPHRGDQIFFGGQGHTGGVVSVNGGTENTIEGNKGDEVRRCSYSIHSPSIIGYGRPKYYLLTGKLTAADMPLLKRGAQGADVETLQRMLIDKGYSCGESGADGSYGPATEAAVRKYQQDRGLEPDGEVGPITWAALIEATK